MNNRIWNFHLESKIGFDYPYQRHETYSKVETFISSRDRENIYYAYL